MARRPGGGRGLARQALFILFVVVLAFLVSAILGLLQRALGGPATGGPA
jgi:hypothetical protein